MSLYKAVRPDGTSFHPSPDGTRVRWTAEDGAVVPGMIVRHPVPKIRRTSDAATYLSVSTEPADCTGFEWPCRLLTVEPVTGDETHAWTPDPTMRTHKRGARRWRVTGEVEAWRALGPNGRQVAAYLDLLPTLTSEQWHEARHAAWDVGFAAWDAARNAARYAAAQDAAAWDVGFAARDVAARYAARYAAVALVVRDLITPDQFATLTAPMRAAGVDFDRLVTA